MTLQYLKQFFSTATGKTKVQEQKTAYCVAAVGAGHLRLKTNPRSINMKESPRRN